MVLDFFRSARDSTVDEVQAKLVQMLRDGCTVYDTAMGAVFGGGKSKETKAEVKSTDHGINVAQQEVRTALIIHASTGSTVDLPLAMAYMSVVKDVERIGDYAKNIYDLAKYGADFTSAVDRAELERYRDAVAHLIDDTADAFEERDSDKAERLIAKADGFLDDYDSHVEAAFQSDGPASEAVARALYYRHLKRITAHLMNVMTVLVMPVHRLDYYDEAKDDRT